MPKIILVFIAVEWPLFMRRKMLYGLSKSAKKYGSLVVAVSRPLCPFTTLFKKPKRFAQLFGPERLEQLDENMYMFSPRYILHDHIARRFPFLVERNLNSLRRSYKKLARRLNVDEPNPAVWFYYPQQSYVTKLFPESLRIFELKDNLSGIFKNGDPLLQDLERQIRGDVDILLTTSHALHKTHGPNYPDAIHFGNGLDRDSFDKLTDDKTPTIPKIMSIDSPRIGYAGIISERIYWDVVRALAEKNPNWNFVFAGPIANPDTILPVKNFKNIHFVGSFPHTQVPSVLKSFDIGLMPYLDTEFFHRSNPLKFYEYAAAGLPSVSSKVEELKLFSEELVTVAGADPKRWQEAIERYLRADRKHLKQIGAEVAGRFVWENMTDDLLSKINLLQEKRLISAKLNS